MDKRRRNGLFCLVCCPPWPSRIAAKIAFRPPRPTYSFFRDTDHSFGLYLLDRSDTSICGNTRVECFFVTSSMGNRIACAFFRCTTKPRYTILFSHGNAADIGRMHDFFISLGDVLTCNFFCYDYSGYGISSGSPSEKNLYADIDCVWAALSSRYGVPPEQTILYGQSLGTVPTVDLASRTKPAGVILHSPLLSALRIFTPMKKTWWCDFFVNVNKVPKIKSPVLVIHGVEDEMVPFIHGVSIYDMCTSRVNPLWVHGAGHNFIEYHWDYFKRLKHFLNEVDFINLENNSNGMNHLEE